jgi:hypothetical protein
VAGKWWPEIVGRERECVIEILREEEEWLQLSFLCMFRDFISSVNKEEE